MRPCLSLRSHLPPPHAPEERVEVLRCGPWSLRAFAADDPRRSYLLAHGMGHIQLWLAAEDLSILTPSRLTGGAWSIDAAAHGRASWTSWRDLAEGAAQWGVGALPHPSVVASCFEAEVAAPLRALKGVWRAAARIELPYAN